MLWIQWLCCGQHTRTTSCSKPLKKLVPKEDFWGKDNWIVLIHYMLSVLKIQMITKCSLRQHNVCGITWQHLQNSTGASTWVLKSNIKKKSPSSSCRGEAETNPTRNHEVAGSTPGLTHWVKDPALPWAVV